MQILAFDPAHRAWFTARNPQSLGWDHAAQVAALLADGLGASRAWALDLTAETFVCFAADGASQGQWTRDHNASGAITVDAILAAQAKHAAPDVILLDSSLSTFLPVLHTTAPQARVLACTEGTESAALLTGFDAVLMPACMHAIAGLTKPSYRLGLRALATADTSGETYDVLCRTAPVNDNVRRHLLALTKSPLGLRGDFSVRYHLTAAGADTLPIGLTMHDHGPLFGAAFLAAAARAHVVVDLDDGTPPGIRADRLLTLARAGLAIVAEDGPVVRACFNAPDTIATFTTPETLLDRVYALLGDIHAPERLRARAVSATGHGGDFLGDILRTLPPRA